MYYSTCYETPIGEVTLASDGENLVGLWMKGQKYFGGTISNEIMDRSDLPVFDSAKDWLKRYFNGEQPKISELPLAPIGSEFRQMIWKILCDIPYGEYLTYGEIADMAAEKMGKEKMSSQAVGGAVGHNPISVIIPCHRVIGANGNLTGFASGIDKKMKLLEHEGADMTLFFKPKSGTAL